MTPAESTSALKRNTAQLRRMSPEWDEADIGERIDRLEKIAETLEVGNVDLTTAKELREEADDHLEWLQAELDVGDGDIVELDRNDVDANSGDGR